jgi:hypothetical protein
MRKKEDFLGDLAMQTILDDAAENGGRTWMMPSIGAAVNLRQRLYIERDRMRKDVRAPDGSQAFASDEIAARYGKREALRIIVEELPDGKAKLTLTNNVTHLQGLTAVDPATGKTLFSLKDLLNKPEPTTAAQPTEDDPLAGVKVGSA